MSPQCGHSRRRFFLLLLFEVLDYEVETLEDGWVTRVSAAASSPEEPAPSAGGKRAAETGGPVALWRLGRAAAVREATTTARRFTIAWGESQRPQTWTEVQGVVNLSAFQGRVV